MSYFIYVLVLLLSLCFLYILRRKPNRRDGMKVNGKVVLVKKHILDFTDPRSSIVDRVYELLGFRVSFQLVSATVSDPKRQNRGVLGEPAYLQGWITKATSLSAGEAEYDVTFYVKEDQGIPGAVIVRNMHHYEFYLETLTLEGVPGMGEIFFPCNSWVYPAKKYDYERIFFTNATCLRSDTPQPLLPYRDDELKHLQGDGKQRELKKHDRVYDYDVYNDLTIDPIKDPRPILGGSEEYPYPRRGRTGRPPTKNDPKTESRVPFYRPFSIYVPRDERFRRIKMSDVLAYVIKIFIQSFFPLLKALILRNDYRSLNDMLDLYRGGLPYPSILTKLGQMVPFELIKELLRSNGERLFRLPMPQVIQADDSAWRRDEEFIRQMLAGLNPLVIRRAEAEEVVDILHPSVGTPEIAADTKIHQPHLMEVQAKRDFGEFLVLDHCKVEMQYLNKINATSNKVYASKTLLSLKNGNLKLGAIMLSRPGSDNPGHEIKKTYFPPDDKEDRTEAAIWDLAKAYVAVNDSGHHQLISHWLKTHAVMEPFVIASHRQLSVMNPIHKLLNPHFRDTMNINALARQTLINAGGIFERTVFPGKYALEMSSKVYKNWNFRDQALPKDLQNRGLLNPDAPNKLLIEGYPYAVDGLAIWSAIETWVMDYCSIYYNDDEAVRKDEELCRWWEELRDVGHGDLEGDNRLPELSGLKDLTEFCTIIIWVASALHAAVNFGQYAYAGYLPNRPTISRRFMPEEGSPEYEELAKNPDGVLLRTITSPLLTLLGVGLIESLSMHSSDEVYLGSRDEGWTADEQALDASKRFRDRLVEIQGEIDERNKDPADKYRNGAVKVPYTLLYEGGCWAHWERDS